MGRVALTAGGLLLVAAAFAAFAWASFLCPDCEAVALRAGFWPPSSYHNPCCPRCGDLGKVGVWNRLRGSPVTPEISELMRASMPTSVDFNRGLRSLLERLLGVDAPRCFRSLREGRHCFPTNVRVFDTPSGWRVAVLIYDPLRAEAEPICAGAILLDSRGRYLDLLRASSAGEFDWRFVAPGLELSPGFHRSEIRLEHDGRPEPLSADRIYVVKGDRFTPRAP